jgi:hypothetical protein
VGVERHNDIVADFTLVVLFDPHFLVVVVDTGQLDGFHGPFFLKFVDVLACPGEAALGFRSDIDSFLHKGLVSKNYNPKIHTFERLLDSFGSICATDSCQPSGNKLHMLEGDDLPIAGTVKAVKANFLEYILINIII